MFDNIHLKMIIDFNFKYRLYQVLKKVEFTLLQI